MSISPTTIGCPRPVGSVYRHRRFYMADEIWMVNVVDTLTGPVIEASNPHGHTVWVATDLPHHTMFGDHWKLIAEALDSDEDWTTKTVDRCAVCKSQPIPMWARRQDMECLTCAARTVLACVDCGAPDGARYVHREHLLAEQRCWSCNHWRSQAERVSTEGLIVTSDYHLYSVATARTSTTPDHCKGFGGRRFTVTFTDGRTVDTDNLWSGSTVPEHLRSLFAPNAEVQAA